MITIDGSQDEGIPKGLRMKLAQQTSAQAANAGIDKKTIRMTKSSGVFRRIGR
jgi:hypothetical protein